MAIQRRALVVPAFELTSDAGKTMDSTKSFDKASIVDGLIHDKESIEDSSPMAYNHAQGASRWEIEQARKKGWVQGKSDSGTNFGMHQCALCMLKLESGPAAVDKDETHCTNECVESRPRWLTWASRSPVRPLSFVSNVHAHGPSNVRRWVQESVEVRSIRLYMFVHACAYHLNQQL